MLLRRFALMTLGIITLSGGISFIQPSLVSSPVTAQTPTNKPANKPGGWLKELNLTPQQLQQIKQIRSQSRNNLQQQKQALRQTRKELQDLMASNANKEQVQQKYNQLKILKTQIADAQFENTLAIREVLNPQQRQKFAERMYKR
jgi:periplasmic protein CpxP/Spy